MNFRAISCLSWQKNRATKNTKIHKKILSRQYLPPVPGTRTDHSPKSPPHTARRALCRFICQFRVRDAEWRISGFALRSQARSTGPAESDSLSYGLVFRRRLLSTPPRGDAAIFGYTVMTFCGKDFHLANRASSRTHERGHPGRVVGRWRMATAYYLLPTTYYLLPTAYCGSGSASS